MRCSMGFLGIESVLISLDQNASLRINNIRMDSEIGKEQGRRRGCKYAKIPLVSKIKLFKGVFEEGQSIKSVRQRLQKISHKLRIKYSTAKTLVRQFRDRHIRINLGVYGNETPSLELPQPQRKMCHYRVVETLGESGQVRDEIAKETNAIETHQEKTASCQDSKAKNQNPTKVEIISTTIWFK